MSSPKPLLVRTIEQLDEHTLGIEWTDGHRSRWRLSHLRRNCPCAECRDEWTGKRLLDAKAVDDNLKATIVQSLGRYAISINFTDGHTTGIYAFTLLRDLCQCEECESARSSAASAEPE